MDMKHPILESERIALDCRNNADHSVTGPCGRVASRAAHNCAYDRNPLEQDLGSSLSMNGTLPTEEWYRFWQDITPYEKSVKYIKEGRAALSDGPAPHPFRDCNHDLDRACAPGTLSSYLGLPPCGRTDTPDNRSGGITPVRRSTDHWSLCTSP